MKISRNIRSQSLTSSTNQEFVHYTKDNSGLGENEIRDMAEDKDGSLWLATWGGGVSKVHLSPSAVQPVQPNNSLLKIFPNPVNANEELVIYCEPSRELVAVNILSSEGILLKHFEIENSIGQHTLELTGMSSGYYIAIAKDSQGKEFTSRFVITK